MFFFFFFLKNYYDYKWLKLIMVVGFVYWLPNIRIFLLIQAKYDRASVSGEMFAIEDSYCFLVICIFFVELFIWRFPIWCLRGCLLCNGILSWLLTLYLYAYFIAEDSLGTFIILLNFPSLIFNRKYVLLHYQKLE